MTELIVRLTESQKVELVNRAASGESLTSLAECYGISRQAVRGILRRRGVPPRVVGKLSEAQRSEVVQRYLDGSSIANIAAAFGVSEPAVRGLLVRRNVLLRKVVHALRHDAFDYLNPDACYWIGFIFADGSVGYRPGYLPQVSVGLAERDRRHLVALREFLGSTASISGPSITHGSCQFSVRSARLADRLIELGRYQGGVDQRLVESRDFWRGVVDGDGSIGIYQTARGPLAQFRLVGSRRILEPFTEFVLLRGLSRLSVRPHKAIYTVGTTRGGAERIIRLLYEDARLALHRKAEMAARILDGRSRSE
ncbi:Sigma-70, region 4 [Micromonospora haikouensis]|uniref:Sigma-70, region 4 n=1 Tax=Micromonospora haikouensis TaxID=686309 RepID=A0A1C4UFD3_9ACTN|nr:sigma-70 region 4 domain-containing protein [Micromonospora haikouensis]SCE70405.1 Sigma-70, region 4 [Micromonospora haikouensis]